MGRVLGYRARMEMQLVEAALSLGPGVLHTCHPCSRCGMPRRATSRPLWNQRYLPQLVSQNKDVTNCPPTPLEPEMCNLYIVDFQEFIKKQHPIWTIYTLTHIHTHSFPKPFSPYPSRLAYLLALAPPPHHIVDNPPPFLSFM